MYVSTAIHRLTFQSSSTSDLLWPDHTSNSELSLLYRNQQKTEKNKLDYQQYK